MTDHWVFDAMTYFAIMYISFGFVMTVVLVVQIIVDVLQHRRKN